MADMVLSRGIFECVMLVNIIQDPLWQFVSNLPVLLRVGMIELWNGDFEDLLDNYPLFWVIG